MYVIFCCATREINTKITLSWAHKQFATRVHTLFSIYTYDTGTSNHLPHVPILKFDSEKTGIRSRGVVVWNNILNGGIDVNGGIDADASETVFKKLLKSVINDEMIWSCINMPTKTHYTDNVDDNCYTSIYYIDV